MPTESGPGPGEAGWKADQTRAGDKAGKDYWDGVWSAGDLPAPVDPTISSLDNEVNLRLHEWLTSFLVPGRKLLEIGCGRSAWLPYFALRHGLVVTGLDYSELGCEQERVILRKAGVDGEVVCADLFSPPERLPGSFDYVFSMGVAEHFEDTTACLRAFSRYLRTGGEMITIIPNMVGAVGWIQRWFDRQLYDKHVRISASALKDAHQNAGIDVSECRYFLSTNFGVNNLNELDPHARSTQVKQAILTNLSRLSKFVWLIERKTLALPPNAITSPYVICRGTR